MAVSPYDEKLINKIMNLLEKSEVGLTATEVADLLRVHRNTARFYLKVMSASGLISSTQKGRVVIYYIKNRNASNK